MATPIVASVVIANGATVSDAYRLGELTLVGIVTPAALTGTALTFQVSVDGTTYVVLKNSGGTDVPATVTTSKAYYFDPNIFLAWNYVKLVSGSAEGGARTIQLVLRSM